jgi:peptidoglycan hydrolase-like protein with peptidoglycan-binding domain
LKYRTDTIVQSCPFAVSGVIALSRRTPVYWNRRVVMPDEPASNEMGIVELQARLRDLGYYDGPLEDRPWQATLEALERFQSNHGLQVTRTADSATARALRDAVCF